MDPNGLQHIENSELTISLQIGSVANLGITPSFCIEEFPSEDPPSFNTSNGESQPIFDPTASDDDIEAPPLIHSQPYDETDNDNLQLGPTPPTFDPILTAMLTLDASATTTASPPNNEPVDKYLPEPQSFKAVLKLDDDICSAWLHAIKVEIKNLIDHNTFILGEQPQKHEPIIPVKLVLKAKQTASGKLDKLKACIVAHRDMEMRRIKIMKATYQQHFIQQKQEDTTSTILPIDIPQPFKATWSPCPSSRGVKLLLSTTCAARHPLKSGYFIGTYLQAQVIDRHFVKLPLKFAPCYFPEYAKFFGVPLLLDKNIYGLVYSDKDCNIEFSEWLCSQGFIQSQAEPSYFAFHDQHNQWLRLLFFANNMHYVESNNSIEKSFEDSVRNRFDVKFLGPAQWFLLICIHQHNDSTDTLDQHRYVLNSLQRDDPDSEFPERETPFPPDYTFSKDNRPVTENDNQIIEKRYSCLPFCSAVCTLLYVAYNTCADILFAVCKLAKACNCPGKLNYCALIWLFGFLRQQPSYALTFFPDSTSNPIYKICNQHCIPYSDLTVFSDASWQDCPETGQSTTGYMIFHHGALIEVNSTMPTPVAMSTSEAEYMAACSATMATAHICMLLYDITYLGTKQWHESSQRLPTTSFILMVNNKATAHIAKNGKLTCKTRHIEQHFHFVCQGQQDGTHQLHWIPCESQLADILTKTHTSSKIDSHLGKIFCTLPDHLLSPSPISTEI